MSINKYVAFVMGLVTAGIGVWQWLEPDPEGYRCQSSREALIAQIQEDIPGAEVVLSGKTTTGSNTVDVLYSAESGSGVVTFSFSEAGGCIRYELEDVIELR